MPDVHAEFEDGHWRVVDSDRRRYSISPIAGFKQQGGRFVTGNSDVTTYGWDDMTRMPNEWTAQLVAGVLQLWVNEMAERERAAERRAKNTVSMDELTDALGECFGGYPHSMATELLARFVVTKKST